MKKFAFLCLFFLVLAGAAQALTRSEVEKNLICYRCPGEALNIDSCSGGDLMRAEIDRGIEQGKDLQTILNSFVERFGEGILTAPPKKGLNLVAYAAPFVGLFIGLIIAGIVVWKWAVTGRNDTSRQAHNTEAEVLYFDMEDKVKDELKKLEDV